MTPAFAQGFLDELEKGAVVGRLAGKAGRLGTKAFGKVLPYGIAAGIPAYFGLRAVSEGFGRGVASKADEPLPHER